MAALGQIVKFLGMIFEGKLETAAVNDEGSFLLLWLN